MTSPVQFPNDENGNVLRRMAAAGTDLVSPRIVDFEHCFPNEASAKRFHEAIRGTVLEAILKAPDAEDGTGWEVQCRQPMIPTHAAITETENRLAAAAMQFEGYADGWGTLSNPDGSPVD